MPSHRPHVRQVLRMALMASAGSGSPAFGRAVTSRAKARETRLRHRSVERRVFLLDVSTEASAKQSAQPSFAAPSISSSPTMRPKRNHIGSGATLSLRQSAARRAFHLGSGL